jgi:hypothetical protein
VTSPPTKSCKVNRVGAVQHLRERGITITLGALASRVARKTIPHIRTPKIGRNGETVWFETAELDAWAAGSPVKPQTKEQTP